MALTQRSPLGFKEISEEKQKKDKDKVKERMKLK